MRASSFLICMRGGSHTIEVDQTTSYFEEIFERSCRRRLYTHSSNNTAEIRILNFRFLEHSLQYKLSLHVQSFHIFKVQDLQRALWVAFAPVRLWQNWSLSDVLAAPQHGHNDIITWFLKLTEKGPQLQLGQGLAQPAWSIYDPASRIGEIRSLTSHTKAGHRLSLSRDISAIIARPQSGELQNIPTPWNQLTPPSAPLQQLPSEPQLPLRQSKHYAFLTSIISFILTQYRNVWLYRL